VWPPTNAIILGAENYEEKMSWISILKDLITKQLFARDDHTASKIKHILGVKGDIHAYE
jgi:hypothetical protein